MSFYLAQVCGIIVFILTVISVHFKTKEKIVMCFVFANIVVAIQFFLLNAITGAVETINGLLECVDNVELKDVVYGTGLHNTGEALDSKAYNEAYEFGKNI